MKQILDQLIEGQEFSFRQYKELYGNMTGSTEKQLLQRILVQKKFELEALKLLASDNVPRQFLSFGIITDHEVNFREAPSPAAKISCILEKGTPVILTEKRGNWVGLQLYNGTPGWVFKDYVRAND